MEILELLKKLPKYMQVILSDCQIVFSGENDFVSAERVKILLDTVKELKSHIQSLENEVENLGKIKFGN